MNNFGHAGWNDQTIEEEIESWNDYILMEALAAPNDDLEIFLDEEEQDDDYDNWGNDTARDCIGWEEDMIKNGEFF
ncbi:hypothetical protein EG329_007238 [Mollisiaceae sp. DMI_Dod_QoI]|nr:hypothetical protein EG329_007238 [Helotiales sp. DMI_Dod_QoI]